MTTPCLTLPLRTEEEVRAARPQNMFQAMLRGAAETVARDPHPLAESPKQRLDRVMAESVKRLGPPPCPAPMRASKSRGGEYLPEPCTNPREISSKGYTRNCFCGWPMGAHKTGGEA